LQAPQLGQLLQVRIRPVQLQRDALPNVQAEEARLALRAAREVLALQAEHPGRQQRSAHRLLREYLNRHESLNYQGRLNRSEFQGCRGFQGYRV
jgi:hypothetical protein